MTLALVVHGPADARHHRRVGAAAVPVGDLDRDDLGRAGLGRGHAHDADAVVGRRGGDAGDVGAVAGAPPVVGRVGALVGAARVHQRAVGAVPLLVLGVDPAVEDRDARPRQRAGERGVPVVGEQAPLVRGRVERVGVGGVDRRRRLGGGWGHVVGGALERPLGRLHLDPAEGQVARAHRPPRLDAPDPDLGDERLHPAQAVQAAHRLGGGGVVGEGDHQALLARQRAPEAARRGRDGRGRAGRRGERGQGRGEQEAS